MGVYVAKHPLVKHKLGMLRKHDVSTKNFRELAPETHKRMALILDPMLSTGGTLVSTIGLLKEAGCVSIRGIFLVAAPKGIDKVTKAHPDVDIYLAGVNDHLNDKGTIIPGLGDAGDKIFGTK